MQRSVAVILTKNRADILRRAIDTITGHHPDMPIIVIDDSPKKAANANRRALKAAETGNEIRHAEVRALRGRIRQTPHLAHLDALCSSAPRDISGPRNLSLLLSAALHPDTVFCVDDDMVTCLQERGRPCFFDTVMSSYPGRANLVIGGRMAGIIDDSCTGRICRLSEMGGRFLLHGRLASSRTEWNSSGHPLWQSSHTIRARRKRVLYASGGLSAIKVAGRDLLPFPPGYNEDWNWCLLQSAMRGTSVLLDGYPSYHSPPTLRNPSASGIAWESLGDAMFYALRRASLTQRRFTLDQLQDFVLAGDSIRTVKGQMTYTANLLGAIAARQRGRGRTAANIHKGRLAEAARVLAAQDAGAFARSWFRTQEERIESLGRILRSPEAKHTITSFMDGCTA